MAAAVPPPEAAVDDEPLLPQASSATVARPAAPPVNAARRVNARNFDSGVGSSLPSAHSSRSIASSTRSVSDISPPSGPIGHHLVGMLGRQTTSPARKREPK